MTLTIQVPEPELTPIDKLNFATEVAFSSLLKQAAELGLISTPVSTVGLMYLPVQAVTRQFQEACRAVLALLENK
jgi:hypothetical protein